MAKSPVEVWLWLLLVMQPFSNKTAEILAQCGGDATAASRMVRDGEFPFLSEKEKQRAGQVRMSAIRPILELCSKNDIRIMTLDDDDYPKRLRETANPPIVLFVAGSLEGFDERPAIAAVGARNVSEYSMAAAKSIISPLAHMGVSIVSGLAVGSDSAAHRAALGAGGYTLGVLGCGIMVNYPAENAGLKREIVENGGAVISEMLPFTKTFAGYFPTRNRIISGLCDGTLVIEASERSGSLLTANHAVSQGREVFCIPPHDILSARYAGAAQLLRDGAVCVFNCTDILSRLMQTYSSNDLIRKIMDETSSSPQDERPKRMPKGKEPAEKKPAGHEDSAPDEELLSTLDPNEAAVLRLISEHPSAADELVETSGLDFSALSEALTNLELFGHISREMDGVYSVCG